MKAPIAMCAILGAVALGTPANADAQGAPYCSDLKRLAAMAMTQERFAAITGKAREGNFLETSLSLMGWNNCALYGAATYTCDSPVLGTAEEAESAQAEALQQIKACLGDGWAEAVERSSSRYVVLRSVLRPVSITLSTDETDDKKHIVHLILFVREN
jgi:hypothetical protein